ncbi:diguanylate cyclase [Sphingomonas sp. MMS24-JH45]
MIGVLFLRGDVAAESRFRLTVLTENIASALVNHQSATLVARTDDPRSADRVVQPPLHGGDAVAGDRAVAALEAAAEPRRVRRRPFQALQRRIRPRCRRRRAPGRVDRDAQPLPRRRRGVPVGGEEFTIIAPGTNAAALMTRVEMVRTAISELTVRAGGRALGPTSMSFGIATWNDAMSRDGVTLIQAADAALYEAKRSGRNRAAISLVAA